MADRAAGNWPDLVEGADSMVEMVARLFFAFGVSLLVGVVVIAVATPIILITSIFDRTERYHRVVYRRLKSLIVCVVDFGTTMAQP